jgi:hypothetical protein
MNPEETRGEVVEFPATERHAQRVGRSGS